MRSPLTAALFAVPLLSGPAAAADLTVMVDALRSTAGTVHVALYDSADSFPKSSGMLADRVVPATAPVATFADLAPGTYAVAVYHDENANEKFDQGLLGLPLEGYAFSSGATGFLGPPSFANAAFAVETQGRAITIPMMY